MIKKQKKPVEQIHETKNCFFQKLNKIGKTIARLKNKREAKQKRTQTKSQKRRNNN